MAQLNDLLVLGNTSLVGETKIYSNTGISGTLTAESTSYFKDNLSISRTSNTANPYLVLSSSSGSSYLQLNGTTTGIGNGWNNSLLIDNAGNVTIPGTLTVTGSTTLKGQTYLRDGSYYSGLYFSPTMGSSTMGYLYYFASSSSELTKYTSGRFAFRGYSYTTGTLTRSSYYEQFYLPTVNADRTANASYNILTTKSAVTVAQGGTGATSAANARTNLGVPPTNHASTANTYGVGDSTKYGHVILYNAASCTSYTSDSGGACTPAAVKKAVQTFGLTTSNSQLVDTSAAATALASVVSIGSATPASTYKLWIDTGNGSILKYYNGSSWVKAGAIWS